jgi:hypothetical protein
VSGGNIWISTQERGTTEMMRKDLTELAGLGVGPDYRLATRGERIIDGLLAARDLAIACVAGSIALTAVFVLVGFGLPSVISAPLGQGHSAAAGNSTVAPIIIEIERFARAGFVIVGVVVALYVGARVTRSVLRHCPLRGSPVRPVQPEPESPWTWRQRSGGWST